jgi:hypothetical protein
MQNSIHIPNCNEFLKGIKEFRKREGRDPMYKVASFWILHFWGKQQRVVDGLGVLLLTWNQAFYRYGGFNFNKLEKFLIKNRKQIEKFRKRNIETLKERDKKEIIKLFNGIMNALKSFPSKRKSPVAAVKALHLLAPKFFPLWDDKIAKAYNCGWKDSNHAAKKYIEFCKKIQKIENQVKNYIKKPDVPILKLIDEYNYAKYTKNWI